MALCGQLTAVSLPFRMQNTEHKNYGSSLKQSIVQNAQQLKYNDLYLR